MIPLCSTRVSRRISFTCYPPNKASSFPMSDNTTHSVPTTTDSAQLDMLTQNSIVPDMSPSRRVASPYIAAKTPIHNVLTTMNDSKYKTDAHFSFISTAGSTPNRPPGPAIPCSTPTQSARALCDAGSSISEMMNIEDKSTFRAKNKQNFEIFT